jgi:hypothetical protein
MRWEKPSDAAAEAAIWGLVESEAKKRKDAARRWLTEHMGPDLLAVKAIANGVDVGRVSFVEPKTELKVTDRELFARHVQRRYPTEVQLVPVVNPAFEARFLSEMVTIVDGTPLDEGEPVCGVQVVESKPYVSVRKSADAREKVAELMSGGHLSLDGVKELT